MVSPYSLTVPGGVQMQVLGLAAELRRQGHEARVLGPCDGPPPAPFVTPLGNSLPLAANGSIAPLAPDAASTLRTIRALRDESFDVVHVHEPFAPGPSLTTTIYRPAPLVGTFHAAGVSAGYRIFQPALKRFAPKISAKVVVSPDARALIQSAIGGDDFIVLFNGVDLGAIRAAAPYTGESRPAIFFCSRHEERKGLGVLLQAFGRLDDDVRLWIAGEGPDTAELKSRFGGDERIEWLGRVSDGEKLARLRAATVFCAPSLHGESFGVVLIEAMAAGTAIVASALDGYRNVATDEVDSLLVPPGDPAALGGALRRALDDGALRTRLVAAGNARAEDFSMARLAREYVAIYRQAIAAGPRR